MITERIFIKGIDKTNDIASYEIQDDKCLVLFKKGKKSYTYNSENVSIEKKSNDIFSMLTHIANTIKVNEDFSPLAEYYKKITLEQNSLLHKYLNGTQFDKFKDNKPLIFPFNFNKSQYDATKNALKNELSIIQGPPGTGKTQTILNIIANVMIRGGNIAVVSKNAAAVENVKDLINQLT